MVKKRNRDPEVLPEAPAAGGDNDSGSDDVGGNKQIRRRNSNKVAGYGCGQCRIRMVQLQAGC